MVTDIGEVLDRIDAAISEKALAVVEPKLSLGQMRELAQEFILSGFFKGDDNRSLSAAQALTKVMAGQELGIGPFASMSDIHIIKGKVAVGAGIIAALVKRSARYDYRIRKLTRVQCVIAFFEDGEEVGESEFTTEDAKDAGLIGNVTWQKFPRNMLFSRAMTNGVGWYCPDLTAGKAYTPDELGEDLEVTRDQQIVDSRLRDVSVETGEILRPAKEAKRAAMEQKYGDMLRQATEYGFGDRVIYPDFDTISDGDLIKLGVQLKESLANAADNFKIAAEQRAAEPAQVGDVLPDGIVYDEEAKFKDDKAAQIREQEAKVEPRQVSPADAYVQKRDAEKAAKKAAKTPEPEVITDADLDIGIAEDEESF